MKSENALYMGSFCVHFLIKINEIADKIQGTGVTIGQELLRNIIYMFIFSITCIQLLSFIRPLTLKTEIIESTKPKGNNVWAQHPLLQSHGSVSLNRRRISL